jgi:hypothetical protein
MGEQQLNKAEFKFSCPHCGQHISTTPEYVGVQSTCPTCSQPFEVPAPDAIQNAPVFTEEESEYIEAEKDRHGLHWFIAALLTLWCLGWLLVNGFSFFYLTWHLFTSLRWVSFALLINPCFAIWIAFFGSSVWAPFGLIMLPWGRYGSEFSRGKVALLVIFVPMLFGLALQFIGPYFYPVTWGGDDGTHLFLRFIPILGGKGYN